MQIELYIDGEKKIFSTPIIPMLAKRKYLEIEARNEKKRDKAKEKGEVYFPSAQEQLDEDDELVGLLADVIFGGQFTVNQVYEGAENDYIYKKLHEAIFGEIKENAKSEDEQGNNQGE